MNKQNLSVILMQNILHRLDEGIHVIDNEGKTIIYNEAMAQLEGIEREMVINRPLLEIFPSLNEETSTMLTVLNTGRAILNRVQTYLNYNGEKITTVNTTIPLYNDGEKIGALEISKDITKIKELSEHLLDLQQELISPKNKIDFGNKKYTFDNIIGNSESIKKSIDIAKKASKTTSSVLIYGDTGTGKELFAQSIHYTGKRKDMPFIAQNCAALPESLLEGILFGTEKGGFTGAIDRPGLFEQANNGTLLLDEINSMGINLQSKLLRVLQEGYFRRVGGIKDIPVDVRIIATTNEEPKKLVEEQKLRKDLFYRLCVLNVEIPPLKCRYGDIKLLSDYFIKKYNKRLDRNILKLSDEVLDVFNLYDWPGNIRELENIIEGSMNLLSENEQVILNEHLPNYIVNLNKIYEKNSFDKIDTNESLPDIMSKLEKELIVKRLLECNHNISKAAVLLNIKRQTLQHKIKKYKINK